MSTKREYLKRAKREKRRQQKKERSIKKFLRAAVSWILAIAVAAVVGYALVSFCFQTVYVVGNSMSPALQNDDKVIVNKICYLLGSPDRYDIVAFRSVDSSDEYYDIKRVIGLPGETVLIEDGKIFINGEELSDLPFDDYIFTAGLAEDEITLSNDEYFVLGDNVNNSEDSRFPNVGNILENEILGRIKE